MALLRTLQAGLGLLLAVSVRGFAPFAGVQELRPHRIEEHCEPGGGSGKLRWCSRSFQTTLEDGGDVQLDWRMNVDPSSILSLDTEVEHGVRLHRCGPRELHLELPESHVAHAAEGKHVVASRFVHNCAHLPDRHLYHRVVGVHRHEWRMHPEGHRIAHVHLATAELPSFAHIVPSLSFSFSYMPVEARGDDPYPEMRTDFGLNRQYLGTALGRQLQATASSPKNTSGSTLGKWLSKMSDKFKNVDGVTQENGGLQEKGPFFTKSAKSTNSILNFAPKQVSNFGWNWNFAMNTSEKPEFNVSMPGTRGWARVYKPYVRIHSGIFLNFSSEFREITEIPIVKWKAGMKGKGEVNGKLLAWLNTTAPAGVDPFKAFNVSILEQYAIPRWFQKIDFATGSVPLSLEPGFQFKAEMYHQGDFKGAVGLGGRTQGPFDAWVSYDSDEGFENYWDVRLSNTTFWPPIWLIFTKEFEMGLKFRPSILMRGDFADLEKATMAIEMEHYMNMTITRDHNESTLPTSQLKPLVVYPVRVMGLPTSAFEKRYKVQVLANGHSVETSPVINWGQVSFRDHIEKFRIGSVPQATVTQEDLVAVTLTEVDTSSSAGEEKVLGTGSVRCTSLLNGECHPSPSIAYIKSGGTEVAAVELEVVWDTSYAHRLASHIRGLALSIPQVDVKSKAVDVMVASNVSEPSDKFSIHLLHSGREYVSHLSSTTAGGGLSDDLTFSGDTTFEFEANFIETWTQCPKSSSSKCESPTLDLYFGNKLIASNQIPQIEWTSPAAMRGTKKSLRGTMDVPVAVALNDPKTTETLAVVKLHAQILAIAASSTFMVPNGAKEVFLGQDEFLVWTVSNVVKEKDYTFSLQALRLVEDTPSTFHNLKVGGRALVPIPSTTVLSQGPCHPVALKGMSAEDSPCNFQHHFSFDQDKFKAGDVVIILVQWRLTEQGTSHSLWSPPLQVVDQATAAAKSSDQTAIAASRRLGGRKYLQTANKIMEKHEKSCNNKNLQFKLGGGLRVRGKVSSLTLPKGFPMVGGLDEAPQLATRWRKITNMKPAGTDMKRLSGGDGSLACEVGLCSGMLPGCRGPQFNKTTIPVIHLHPKGVRKFSFKNKTGERWTLFKGMLAYAFSTLPETVNIMIKSLNETGSLPGATTTTTMVPILGPGTELGSGGSPTQEPVVLSVTTSKKPADPKNLWAWGDGRRLSSKADEMPSGAHGDLLTITFKEPLPYHIDEDHMELLLDAGYFSGLEDDAGEVELAGFHLQHRELTPGSESISAVELLAHVEDRNLRVARTSASKVALAVLAGIVGLAGIISFRLSVRRAPASALTGALE